MFLYHILFWHVEWKICWIILKYVEFSEYYDIYVFLLIVIHLVLFEFFANLIEVKNLKFLDKIMFSCLNCDLFCVVWFQFYCTFEYEFQYEFVSKSNKFQNMFFCCATRKAFKTVFESSNYSNLSSRICDKSFHEL